MNEARDYAIKAAYPYHTAKATTQGEKTGFTGMSLTSDTPYFEFAIWSKEPFDAVTVLHHEAAPALMEPDSLNPDTYCTIYNTPQSTRIVLNRATDSLTLNGFTDKVFNRPEYYGFSLENGGSGLLYHALGLNSAAFEHFASGTTLLAGGAADLMPDIVIVSLGTNNCYGNNFDAGRLGGVADNFIRRLKQAYPDAALLITTPMESYKKSGRKRIPNPNVREAAVVIKAAAAKNGVACWDLFEAAGGNGANEKWYKRKLTSRDRIHFTEEGYILQADMLYDAFAKYYNSSLTLQKDSTACSNS
jgi:lysophospholipase L1-like esterase